MALQYEQVNTYVRRLIKPKLHSSYLKTRALLYFMAGAAATNLNRLGDPQMGVVFGGMNLGAAQRETLNGSYNHEFKFQKAKTDAGGTTTGNDPTPVATKNADENVALAGTRWVNFWHPLRISEAVMRAAKGDLAVGKVLEDAVGMGFQQALDKQQDSLWTGTLNAAQQDGREWPNHIGLTHTVSDGTTDSSTYDPYGGQLRSVYSQLKANINTQSALQSAGAIPDKKPTLSLIRQLRIINAYGGIANQNYRAGRLVITTPDLWNVLAVEAEGKHTIYDAGKEVPGVGMAVGFEYPIIKKDTTFITYDTSCPTGELYMLTPEVFTYELQAGGNYEIQPWVEKWQTEEGGAYYRWTQIHAVSRFTCEEPWLQTKVTGLTVSGS